MAIHGILQHFVQDENEIVTALEDWSRVCVAMEVLGVEQEEEESFWLILAVITNLGVIAKQMGKDINYVIIVIALW
jgi:myosin heavy subunit